MQSVQEEFPSLGIQQCLSVFTSGFSSGEFSVALGLIPARLLLTVPEHAAPIQREILGIVGRAVVSEYNGCVCIFVQYPISAGRGCGSDVPCGGK
jgi:hypothetical protein